jgi:hypothetical protein
VSARATITSREMSNRWRNIRRFLRIDSAGDVEDDFFGFERTKDALSPARRAAAYEEWADFYEWRLEQRATELAGDHLQRHLVEEWTDSMGYCCRRAAVWARGKNPGEWIPQWERRPDLDRCPAAS